MARQVYYPNIVPKEGDEAQKKDKKSAAATAHLCCKVWYQH